MRLGTKWVRVPKTFCLPRIRLASPDGGRTGMPARHDSQTMYGKSARIYDLLYTGSGIKDYAAEVKEIHRIIRESCPAATTLLDVACGTGAHLAALREWYTVEGVDLSPEMLEFARDR